MVDFVYVATVKVFGSLGVMKAIDKRKVVRFTKAYVTIDHWGSKIKLPTDRCSTSIEGARKIAEGRSQELIAKLEAAIANLKAPAEESDRVDPFANETSKD